MTKMRKSRLSQHKQTRLIEHFVAGTTARVAGSLVGVNKTTAAYYFHRLREIVALSCYTKEGGGKDGEDLPVLMQIDQDYFGPKTKYKDCRGNTRKIPVFGLLKTDDQIHILIPEDLVDQELSGYMTFNGGAMPDATIYYVGESLPNIVDVKDFHEHRTRYPHDEGSKHYKIADFESFWSHAKRHMERFNGVRQEHLHVFLKECEWRYNYPEPLDQYNLLKKWVKKYMG